MSRRIPKRYLIGISAVLPTTRRRGFRWHLKAYKPTVPELTLLSRHGRSAASVFLTRDLNGHNWFVWDEHGTGGENSCEDDIRDAMREAEQALIRSGWHR